MNTATATTVTIGRVGTGSKVHEVRGNSTKCDRSGRSKGTHHKQTVTVEQARELVTCERCAR